VKTGWTGARGPIACVHLPHFPWQTEVARRPEFEGKPLIIVGAEAKGAAIRNVLDCSPDLEGVVPGMPLSEALSRQRGITLLEPDMPFYRLTFDRVLKALCERCPDVEDDGLGQAYVGIWGLEGLYGDDAHVVRVLANAVHGFDLRIGIGENKWLSYVAAAGSEHGRGRKVTGEPGRFMSRFQVDILPVPYESIQRLHGFGLHRMGDVAALPKGALQAQFGPEGARIWELANGMDGRPLVSRQQVEVVSEYLTFPDATANLSAILPAIESLLARAYTRPEMSRRFAREAALEAQVFRRSPWTLKVAFKEPAGSKNHALFAIKVKLDGIVLPGPLEDLRLTLGGLTGEAGRQESMWSEVRRGEQLQVAVRQLHARLGEPPPIYQVREMEPWSRIPERRHALVQLSP
jgi:DNA polymerase-4/protein ImuB